LFAVRNEGYTTCNSSNLGFWALSVLFKRDPDPDPDFHILLLLYEYTSLTNVSQREANSETLRKTTKVDIIGGISELVGTETNTVCRRLESRLC